MPLIALCLLVGIAVCILLLVVGGLIYLWADTTHTINKEKRLKKKAQRAMKRKKRNISAVSIYENNNRGWGVM